ncbi:YciI family protein [Lacinutrix sp. 5H-3-7-4]|uniref:YciI family protein n=1 Tax=Lacinutrix sp. (strain 5H-3-7-4) TaxID=983544 RepID=UPI00020A370D|nr:YciI family protein [Lacinutrix sp. 5H-3-7-4]AEH00808.1 phenylalanyl-tRNA synthetase subunit alpha [Lacinutrix sp. 5H-3-7-4]
MKKILLLALFVLTACNQTEKSDNKNIEVSSSLKKSLEQKPLLTSKQQLEALKNDGFKVMDYVDEKTKDTVIMQQYFMAFLKSGPIRNQNEEEATRLQKEHLAHLGKMYDLGYADISGPFGDNGDLRGITIYNVPNLKMADSLANADPMVKAGRLEIEIHPWWAAKGYSLR